jgi:hypothetical protein
MPRKREAKPADQPREIVTIEDLNRRAMELAAAAAVKGGRAPVRPKIG